MERRMAMVNIIGRMAQPIREIFVKVSGKEKASGQVSKAIIMRASLKMTKKMGLESSNGKMATSIKANSSMMQDKAKARWCGKMGALIRVIGKMEYRTVLVLYS